MQRKKKERKITSKKGILYPERREKREKEGKTLTCKKRASGNSEKTRERGRFFQKKKRILSAIRKKGKGRPDTKGGKKGGKGKTLPRRPQRGEKKRG